MNILSIKESPFTPGRPVPLEFFTAREAEIDFMRRKIQQASRGRNENLFIIGERGMGKSSLAALAREIAAKEFGFYGVHCHLGSAGSLPEFAKIVFQRAVAEATDETIFNSLRSLFEKYIKNISMFGIGVEFTDHASDLQGLVDQFLPALRTIYDRISARHKGILLILDDLNGISGHPRFGPFIKSFVDELATSGHNLPLLLVLVGLPERRIEMVTAQPSVARIFDLIALKPMGFEESRSFFVRSFSSRNLSMEDSTDRLMAGISQGYPMLMHEVGDAVFWEDSDGRIAAKDTILGIERAVINIGTKYLDPGILESLKSDKYRSILTRIADREEDSFSKQSLTAQLSPSELRVFHNFVAKFKKSGLIKVGESEGDYAFTNYFYWSYIRMRFSEKSARN